MVITKIVLAACAIGATGAGVASLFDDMPARFDPAIAQYLQTPPPPAIEMGQLARAFHH